MITYKKGSMVQSHHIKEIDEQLKKFGSKVEEKHIKDNNKHPLSLILYLALGKGKFRVPLEEINKIATNEFEIQFID